MPFSTVAIEPLGDFSAYGDKLSVAHSPRPPLIINDGNTRKYAALTSLDSGRDGAVSQHLYAPKPRLLPLPLTLVERHPQSAQSFFPLAGEAWLSAVATDDEQGRPAVLRAFHVPGDTGLCYRRAVWHFPLLALSQQAFLVSDSCVAETDEFFYFDAENIRWLVDEKGTLDDKSARFLTLPSGMDKAAFLKRFGEVAECSPWVAERVWRSSAKKDTVNELHQVFCRIVLDAGEDDQDALLAAHPPLAEARWETLTARSQAEQAGANLSSLPGGEWRAFAKDAAAYRERFGFPFIIAVAGHSREEIVASLRRRIRNDSAAIERCEALHQVFHIFFFRLRDLAGAS